MRRFSSLILLRSIPKKVTSPRSLCQSRFLFSGTTYNNKSCDQNQTFYFPNTTSFLSSNQQCARLTTLRDEEKNRNQLEVEIISKEFIKPTTPTPQHLSTYEVSLFDQICSNFYMPFVYFYPHNHKSDSQLINHDDLTMKRRQLLKKSLSETLTKFYPLAGRIKDTRRIDCNDNGVHYVEAKVNDLLSDFLKHPDNKSIHRLLPFDPDSKELRTITDLVMVQVTLFSCGGIAIGIYTSHKILDGYSAATFFKAWAATARGCSPAEICPKFIAPSIFPPNPALSENTGVLPMFPHSKTSTKRFVFRASALATLKKKAGSSRAMAVMGLIWKCVTINSKCDQKYSSLTMMVNLRERSSPPMPPYCIGNIFWPNAPVLCSADEDLGLDSVVQRIKNSTDKINEDLIQVMKGEGFSDNMEKPLNELKMFYSDRNTKHMFMTSTCNIGTYETDFGWGKPIWVSFGISATKIPLFENFVLLMDTRYGNGIEAWVTLTEEDMAVFESNPELLSLASMNPSPLQSVE